MKHSQDTTCAHCGIRVDDSKHPNRKYCSARCMGLARRTLTPRPCAICGVIFQPTKRRNRQCSVACGHEARRRVLGYRAPTGPVATRRRHTFAENVTETETCSLWHGPVNNQGYGKLIHPVAGKPIYAHRYAWELAHGPIPAGMFVCHTCDVRNCVRVDHLFLGTNRENILDAKAKGRLATGDRHGSRTHPERIKAGEKGGMAKLTNDQVRTIRQTYAAGGVTHTDLAQRFGVARTTIGHIVNGDGWRSVA